MVMFEKKTMNSINVTGERKPAFCPSFSQWNIHHMICLSQNGRKKKEIIPHCWCLERGHIENSRFNCLYTNLSGIPPDQSNVKLNIQLNLLQGAIAAIPENVSLSQL